MQLYSCHTSTCALPTLRSATGTSLASPGGSPAMACCRTRLTKTPATCGCMRPQAAPSAKKIPSPYWQVLATANAGPTSGLAAAAAGAAAAAAAQSNNNQTSQCSASCWRQPFQAGCTIQTGHMAESIMRSRVRGRNGGSPLKGNVAVQCCMLWTLTGGGGGGGGEGGVLLDE
jgi:hypothetical protein